MKICHLLMLTSLLGLAATSCSRESQAAQTAAAPTVEAPAEALTNIKVRTLEPARLTETVTVRGTALADRDVTYAAELAGPVTYLKLEPGDKVRRGQLLAKIDFALYQAQRDQAKVAHDLARKTHERLMVLKGRDMVSQQKLDEVEARMQGSAAALQIAQIQLDKATVNATISGVVTRRHVERGEFVGPGQPLLQVIDLDTIVISARVSEREVSRLRAGQPVRVTIDALDHEVDGRVHAVLPDADRASKTFELRVKIDNPDQRILAGMAATMRITTRIHDDAVVVAQDVVVESDRGRAVFVEKDGRAVRRPVKLGAIEADRVLVVQGLGTGERLIVEGQRDLSDGAPVNVVPDAHVASNCDTQADCGRS